MQITGTFGTVDVLFASPERTQGATIFGFWGDWSNGKWSRATVTTSVGELAARGVVAHDGRAWTVDVPGVPPADVAEGVPEIVALEIGLAVKAALAGQESSAAARAAKAGAKMLWRLGRFQRRATAAAELEAVEAELASADASAGGA